MKTHVRAAKKIITIVYGVYAWAGFEARSFYFAHPPPDAILISGVHYFCLCLSVIAWIVIHHPFNAIFVSKHSKIGTPGAVANRHFNTSAC